MRKNIKADSPKGHLYQRRTIYDSFDSQYSFSETVSVNLKVLTFHNRIINHNLEQESPPT